MTVRLSSGKRRKPWKANRLSLTVEENSWKRERIRSKKQRLLSPVRKNSVRQDLYRFPRANPRSVPVKKPFPGSRHSWMN